VNWLSRPVILLGHGARCAGADCAPLLELGVPVITSWAAKDLVDNEHTNYFGSSGVYGNRMANRILFEADQVLAIGNRLSTWNVGYTGIRPDQQLIMVDCDAKEIEKAKPYESHFGIRAFVAEASAFRPATDDWQRTCNGWGAQYPWMENGTHDDSSQYINSFRFTAALQQFLRTDEVITVDAGCMMVPAFQVLSLKPPQRMMTSGGLGEMGCAIPAAIGASFARGKGEVLCIVGDGGAMLNLQELQTIVHHRLPIKIIVFNNDGYLMIKRSQGVLGYERSGVDRASGVSCPSFVRVADAFGIKAWPVWTWDQVSETLPAFFAHKGPALVEYFMDHEQVVAPKLDPVRAADGTISSPEFWDMSPRLA
jgi:acetolactate synthase I/II/III large subunit